MADGYRGPQVCKYVGITYRQLDYWARTGLLTPSIQGASGSGSQRLYSFQDLVLLRTIKSLIEAGMSLQRGERQSSTSETTSTVISPTPFLSLLVKRSWW